MAMAMDEIRRLRARLAEMAAEIERLREELSALKGLMQQSAQIWQTETDRCHARIAELEAIVTVGHGTMGTLVPDKPARYTHNIPPSAPPHDKPLSIIAINEATAKALEIMNEPDPDDE
jgi:chromosome segregation ATPase